ncbi:hypothetical protein GOBAR_AA27880 [Gossypium barbadense]|uniref:40S ribosomal protein S27 n=1 Tax=Gossypium barbadense TaxID=3634 RepID=A0A2P5WNZ7_GOSBA|nr:hypothetical protein GOBAR_AA27880 [Gossypium barbadense]
MSFAWGLPMLEVLVLQNDIDLLNPPAELEKKKHKLKRLVQSPNSFFMDVKCQGCFNITTVFSHSQTVVVCGNCQTVLCQPTGGRARLTEGCSFRKKAFTAVSALWSLSGRLCEYAFVVKYVKVDAFVVDSITCEPLRLYLLNAPSWQNLSKWTPSWPSIYMHASLATLCMCSGTLVAI